MRRLVGLFTLSIWLISFVLLTVAVVTTSGCETYDYLDPFTSPVISPVLTPTPVVAPLLRELRWECDQNGKCHFWWE